MTHPAGIVEALASEPAGTREDVLAVLGSVEAHRSWVSAREARWVRYLDGLAKDPASPAKNTAGEVERRQKVSAGEARKRTVRSEQLGSLPGTEDALENGSITDAHADVLARARAKADAKAKAELESNEARLLAHAGNETVREFAKRIERFVHQHSDDDGRDAWDRKKAQRRFWLRRNSDGMYHLGGQLDPELGLKVKQTLDRENERLFRRDHQDHPEGEPVPFGERDNEQRYADALGEVCRKADEVDKTPVTADKAVVILHHDDLVEDLNRHGISPTLADGTPVPASVARRLACDAGLIPVVLNGDSVPLDLGRSARVASPAQRAGLGLQWDTCCVADCTVTKDWCEVHHITEWDPNRGHGMTDLANLIFACRANCHDLVHQPGWSVEKHADGSVTTTGPDGTVWHRTPNGPGVPDRRTGPPPAAATDPDPTGPAATLFDHAA